MLLAVPVVALSLNASGAVVGPSVLPKEDRVEATVLTTGIVVGPSVLAVAAVVRT